MFKKLKAKIAEEVKPLKIPQFAQSVVSPSDNAVVESPPDASFSLDDEVPEDSLGNEGFSVVDLHHPSLPVPSSSGRFSRQSSMSSLASDASAFLPIHDVSLGAFNMQDLESASEREDVLPQMNSLSKQELCNSYLKLYRHYQKYKGRASDLKNFCRELEKDNKKHKTVLLECQEKSLRRMAELKEQCALEQHAKAHLEEALRNDLEEKDHLIQTLQTKIKLLKDVHLASSSAIIRAEDESLLQISGEMRSSMEELLRKGDSQTSELELKVYPVPEKLHEEGEVLALKERIEFFNEQVMKNLSIDLQDISIKTQLQDLLNEISHCLTKKTFSPSFSQKKANNAIDKILLQNETSDKVQEHFTPQMFQKNSNEMIENEFSNIQLDSVTSLELGSDNLLDCSADLSSKGNTLEHTNTVSCQNMETKSNLKELENELVLTKEKFEKVTQELQDSHQKILEQNSTITTLQKNLNTLECDYRGKIMESDDTIKIELAETKKQFKEIQEQIITARHNMEKKDLEIKETKQSLLKIQQELDKSSVHNTEITSSLTAIQLELTNTKCTCEQLTQNLQAANEVIKEKESTNNHLNNKVKEISQELVEAKSRKLEESEIITDLENELKETKLRGEKITEELAIKTKSNEENESAVAALKLEVTKLHKELEILNSQFTDASQTASSLLTEIKDGKLKFEETTKELESVQNLVKEKDDSINKTNEELALVRQELDAISKEKADKCEMVQGLQNELSSAKGQIEELCQELQSAHKSIDLKDSDISKMQENLISVQQELNSLSSQKVERSEIEETLQNELKLLKSMTEDLNSKLEESSKSNGIMNNEIANLKQNLEDIKKELNAALLLKDEKTKMVIKLENDLIEAKLQLEKMSGEINSSNKLIEEKDLAIIAMNNTLEDLRNNLELESMQKAQEIQVTTSCKNELEFMNNRLEKIAADLQCSQKLCEEKDSAYAKIHDDLSKLHEQFDIVTSEKNQAKEEIDDLQKKIIDMSINFKRLNEQLQSSHKLLDEKDINIRILTEEVTKKQQELSDLHREFNSVTSEKDQAKKEIVDLQNKITDSINFEKLNEFQSCKLLDEKELNIRSLTEEIFGKQKELSDLREEFDTVRAEKDCAKEEIDGLQKKIIDININYEKLREELESSCKLLEEKDLSIMSFTEEHTSKQGELSELHEKLSLIVSEREQAREELDDLKQKLKNMTIHFKEIKEQLLTSHKLLEEKELNITCLTDEIANMHKVLNTTSEEKQDTHDKLSSLKKELTDTKLQFEEVSQELQSAYHTSNEKDVRIANISDELSSVREELNIMVLQKVESYAMLTELNEELIDVKLNFENLNRELMSANQLVEEKDIVISQLTSDISKIHEELDSLSAVNDEKGKVLSSVEEELHDSRIYFDKMSNDLESAQRLLEEKNSSVAQLRGDLVKVQEELNEASTLQSQANENILNLQQELKDTKVHLVVIKKELESARQQLRDKNAYSQKTNMNESQVEENAYLSHQEETSETVSALQFELESSKLEIEKITEELQAAYRIIEERNANINKLREELSDTYNDINFFNGSHNKDSIKSVFMKENTFPLENPDCESESNVDNREADMQKVMDERGEHVNEGGHIFYKMNIRRKCDEDSSIKDKSIQTVMCSGSEEQKRRIKKLEICSVGSTSFIPEDEITNSQLGCDLALGDSSSNQGPFYRTKGCVTESEEPGKKNKRDSSTTDATCTSQVVNVLESSTVSKNIVHSNIVLSEDGQIELFGKDNVILKNSYKLASNDDELPSGGVPALQFERNTALTNVLEAQQTTDRDEEREIDQLQFSRIQNILDEIQKENKEYGSLLDCHKNIINHLEGITKLHSEGFQPGSAEWLHKQLVLLSQKLYDTKEKQRLQIASINKLVKHQHDLMKSDGNESVMTIEMQYLRNIVFQYMIGKETMLLAKVISAIMKFDQQQMDQVMQKEQQKQTLFGHLGLL